MKIRIYQIDLERDTDRVAFAGLNRLERYQGSAELNSNIYDNIYEGEVACKTLEDVYRMFNLEHPADYTGRSLSVSDIVEVVEDSEIKPGFFFCDTIGFQQVDFGPPSPAEKGTIRVVLLEPGKLARIADIDSSLEGMQKVVGGFIEPVYAFDEEVCLVCNEEGKLNGMALNRGLRYEGSQELWDIVAGPCFICDCSGESFGSLSPEQQAQYKEMFKYPEQFIRINGEIRGIPYTPTVKSEHER